LRKSTDSWRPDPARAEESGSPELPGGLGGVRDAPRVIGMRPSRGSDAPCSTGDPSDADLLSRIAGNSEDAFLLLFRRWAPRLSRFLTRATGSRESGEDLLQETFLRILRAAPRFEPRGNAGAWIYRISANLAYSYWRRQHASPFARSRGAPSPLEVTTPASQSPDSRRMWRAFQRDAISALAKCPGNQRMVFLLKVDQGLTYEQIATALCCPVGTAKSRFHFAVRRLREELKQWETDTNRRDRDEV
jgi:RNA polymerase sigma-70 factor (ECF subfamily)